MSEHFVETAAVPPRTTFANVGAHFARIAQSYNAGSGKVGWCGPAKVLESLLPRIEELARSGKPLRVLDLGAGTGQFGLLLKDVFESAGIDIHVTGIDFCPEMLAIAREEGGVDRAVIGDITDLTPVRGQKFDVIVSCGVFDFLKEEQAAGLCAEIPSLLAPGGVFGITVEPRDTPRFGHKTLQHDPTTLRGSFESAGAVVETAQAVPHIYTNTFRDKERGGAPVENVILAGHMESHPV